MGEWLTILNILTMNGCSLHNTSIKNASIISDFLFFKRIPFKKSILKTLIWLIILFGLATKVNFCQKMF